MTSIVSDESEELRKEIELLKQKTKSLENSLSVHKKSKMRIGHAIGGVILLAIGLMFVVGGGASAIDSLCIGQSFGSCRSDTMTFIGASIVFWIGMIPSIFGVRLVAKA